MAANEVLDREYLQLRAKILELAASFDRLDRSSGSVADDPRMNLLRRGLEVLCEKSDQDDRAERVQLLFSRKYEQDWQTQFSVLPAKPR
jgi:hypothetical protein